MAEVKMGTLYKVTVTEYEAGWGQRHQVFYHTRGSREV
jgi:hypothetical protein